jgi:ferric-dicitrate binding protein FerR (iron transport regulator)
MGSTNPEADLRGMIYVVKRRKEERRQMSREIPVSRQLERAEEELARTRKQFEESAEEEENNTEAPKKSRRWFKGLGQIAQGAAISIADIGIAIGMLHFPVSPETQTLGALVSTATGVGTVLNGIGELRNE